MSLSPAIVHGEHVLGIYSSAKAEIEDCFAFLRAGFDRGEAIWIMKEDLSKDAIRERIRTEWQVKDIKTLEEQGDITITTAQEWYYPDGIFDKERVKEKWRQLTDSALLRGKKGLRAFGSVERIFCDGRIRDHIDYEASLGKSFDGPFKGLCAYRVQRVSESLTGQQLSQLHLSHGVHRIFGFNVLENPSQKQHVALVYDTDEQRDTAVAKYLNKGLATNQLCVYGSVHVRNAAHMDLIASLVGDYQRRIDDGSLIVVDLAPHYVSAMSDNLEPLEELARNLGDVVARGQRENRHVRIVFDCAAFMFKNKHFDEAISVEDWLHQKPVDGSFLCLYPGKVLRQFPYDIHRFRLYACHDIIADPSGNITSAYVSEGARGNEQ